MRTSFPFEKFNVALSESNADLLMTLCSKLTVSGAYHLTCSWDSVKKKGNSVPLSPFFSSFVDKSRSNFLNRNLWTLKSTSLFPCIIILLRRFWSIRGDGWVSLLFLTFSDSFWRRDFPPKFIELSVTADSQDGTTHGTLRREFRRSGFNI